jgi:hypothetical protein
MNLTNDKERILALRKTAEFPIVSKCSDSYWEDVALDSGCLFEMDINTPVELIEALSGYIDDERARVITASAFKCRNAYEEKKKTGNAGDTFLPEFVYNF